MAFLSGCPLNLEIYCEALGSISRSKLQVSLLITASCHPGLDPGSSKILIWFFAQSIANSVGQAQNDTRYPAACGGVVHLILKKIYHSFDFLNNSQRFRRLDKRHRYCLLLVFCK
jgi:hypothetical protein